MTGSTTTSFVMFGAIILIFYFFIVMPQKKKEKQAKAMLNAMKKGDKVVSIGGIHGTVVKVGDTTVVVKVDDNARIEFTKNAISTVVPYAKAAPKKKAAEAAEAVVALGETTEETTAEETATQETTTQE